MLCKVGLRTKSQKALVKWLAPDAPGRSGSGSLYAGARQVSAKTVEDLFRNVVRFRRPRRASKSEEVSVERPMDKTAYDF